MRILQILDSDLIKKKCTEPELHSHQCTEFDTTVKIKLFLMCLIKVYNKCSCRY